MKSVDLLAILVIAVLTILAIWYARRNPGCSGDCTSCHSACQKSADGMPDFVRRYRKDHPDVIEHNRENHHGQQ